jgi:hypothetical protein
MFGKLNLTQSIRSFGVVLAPSHQLHFSCAYSSRPYPIASWVFCHEKNVGAYKHRCGLMHAPIQELCCEGLFATGILAEVNDTFVLLAVHRLGGPTVTGKYYLRICYFVTESVDRAGLQDTYTSELKRGSSVLIC